MRYYWYSKRHVAFCAMHHLPEPGGIVGLGENVVDIFTFASFDPEGSEYKWKDKILVGQKSETKHATDHNRFLS